MLKRVLKFQSQFHFVLEMGHSVLPRLFRC